MLAAVAITLPRGPLVGRRAELEIFEKALCSGERMGLLIHGPAGVRKTRLADECLQWAAARARAGRKGHAPGPFGIGLRRR